MHYVYWIRYDTHSDPLTEGYVGVSVRPPERFYQHSVGDKDSIVRRGIENGATQEILYSYDTAEEAYAKEFEMRPTERIGWNLTFGGNNPPNHYGQDWFRFKGKQPKASCVSCHKVLSWHQVINHICRKQCALDGCDNRVKKITNTYCGKSCSMKSRGNRVTERDEKGRIVAWH